MTVPPTPSPGMRHGLAAVRRERASDSDSAPAHEPPGSEYELVSAASARGLPADSGANTRPVTTGRYKARIPLGRLWALVEEPDQRTRAGLLVGWLAATLVALGLVALKHWLWTGPAIRALPERGAEAANAAYWTSLASSVVVVLAMSALSFYILWYGVIRPVERMRQRMRQRLAETHKQQSSALAVVNYSQQKRVQQLELAMTDNELLREEKNQVENERTQLQRLFKSLFEVVTDRIIVVDRDGRIVEISPLTSDLIGIHRSRIMGESFDASINLYDPFRENPMEYPMRGLAADVIAGASAIPKMTHVLVVAPHGAQERVLMSAAAVLDEAGDAVGAVFRFEADTSLADGKNGPAMRVVKTDRVTGLPGREMFDSRLREMIEMARVRKTHHALLVLGIDNFHAVADNFGQRAAEELLWNVAQILQTEAGTGNQPYRVTADFMAVPLALCDTRSAQDLGQRLCSAVAARVFAWKDTRYESTVSCGIVDVDGECEDVGPLLEMANNAVMNGRSLGGNRVEVLGPEHPEIVRRRSDKQWVDWLLPRLQGGSAHLISQSIVPLQTVDARLPMFEVFVRVEDDDGVWITPGAFMPAVERFGHSAQLDLWVLEAVLTEFAKNPELLEKNAAATINLNGHSLERPEFANDVVQMISMSGISGKRICFEIDEPFAVSRLSAVSAFINQVKGTGAQFALDRYKAAGGLDALRELPISYLKIHESLVRRLNTDRRNPLDRLLIDSLVGMCRARNVQIIAAGIENASALSELKDAGVDYGQGVLINKFGPVMT
jgi:diguanylate cyclase (GGDEF)-like protein